MLLQGLMDHIIGIVIVDVSGQRIVEEISILAKEERLRIRYMLVTTDC
jgi:hypothetical protein